MDAKMKKIIIWCIVVFVITLVLFVSLFDNKDIVEKIVTNDSDNYIYNFGDTVNFEVEKGVEELGEYATSYDPLGNLDVYSDEDAYVYYYDDKARIEGFKGNITVSASWMNEGKANKIHEPEFGILQKFVLENDTIMVNYIDVEMKDVEGYISDLAGLGFNNIILNNKNKKKSSYYYTASKSDGTAVNLNYKDGELYINVY